MLSQPLRRPSNVRSELAGMEDQRYSVHSPPLRRG